MFLSCGDSLYDMFVDSAGADGLELSVNGIAGGSPMNVAVGLARLGHKSAYFTKLSNDIFGKRLRQFLSNNDVDTSLCPDTSLGTTLAFIDKQPDGSAEYSFYINQTADVSITPDELPALPDSIKGIHFGSYSTAVGSVSAALQTLAQREAGQRLISYDPNLRLAIEPDLDKWRDCFKAFASCASFIKASDEDIQALLGSDSEDRFVADCFNLGAQLVYITRGALGASAYTPDGSSVTDKATVATVVDTVGAGDTFQAAVLHWLAQENHIADDGQLTGQVDAKASLQFALKAASITCSRFGANLPTLAELN